MGGGESQMLPLRSDTTELHWSPSPINIPSTRILGDVEIQALSSPSRPPLSLSAVPLMTAPKMTELGDSLRHSSVAFEISCPLS